ncbi:MAG: pseudaminic acid cytidylyltransferase [Acidaminococcales bacterium]|jgi:N-acylneuraminate cytidylyltransferase|nr:pseudaminic acid cytidylyltransferase [Acidaminococcales bacterium]
MKMVAVITARGGSKRIPRKNIKDFLGQPIMAYSIKAALDSGLFGEVMVSTEDAEIAEVARKYGAAVPFLRSAATADDYATTFDVLHEVVTEYDKRGTRFDWLCCLYPTAPFVTPGALRAGAEKLLQSGADCLTPVVKFSFPPQRAFVLDEAGYLVYKWPEYKNSRSQDLQPFYHDAGQFYFYKSEYFFAKEPFPKAIPFLLDDLLVQDIDNVEDWALAEMKYRLLRESHPELLRR